MKHITHRKVTCRGKKDGRDWKWKFWPFKESKPKEPKSNQNFPPQFETELIRGGENLIAQEAEKWITLDRELKPKYCEALAAFQNASKRNLKESQEAEAAKGEFERAKAKYEDITLPALAPKWRNIWLFFICIGEFPLNSVVFSLFGSGRIETYIMAAVLCVIIPLAAHFFGQSLRQENKSKTDLALVIAMPVAILCILGAIAFIRAKFFEVRLSQHLIGISLTPTQMTVLFIIINVAIFLVAVVVSYEGSHADRKYFNTVYARYREALKRMEKEAAEAKEAGREFVRAELALQQIRQFRQKSHEKFVQEVKTLQSSAEWLVSSYRAANMRVRSDTPPCFLVEPKIPEIPEELLRLDWECSVSNAGEKV